MANGEKVGRTREGEAIDFIYQGDGFCYVDVAGRRYGRASWLHKLMDGTGPSGTVRPIIKAFARSVAKATGRA